MNNIELGVYNALYPGKIETVAWPTKKIPTNFPGLYCDGSAVSRTTYADLFNAICPAQNFTVSIASPAVFTVSGGHDLQYGDALRFTTTGALPTGLSTSVTYYIISAGLTSTQFQVSTSIGGAAVNTSGSQSGTHTMRSFNWGIGDGSTTFNIPDLRGVALRGLDDGKTYDTNRILGSYQVDANKSHTHTGTTNAAGTHAHYQMSWGGSSGSSNYYFPTQNGSTLSQTNQTSTAPDHTHTFTTNADGNTETTVKNVACRFVIIY